MIKRWVVQPYTDAVAVVLACTCVAIGFAGAGFVLVAMIEEALADG